MNQSEYFAFRLWQNLVRGCTLFELCGQWPREIKSINTNFSNPLLCLFSKLKPPMGELPPPPKKVQVDRILLNPAIAITKLFFSTWFCLVINDKILCLVPPQSAFVCLYFFSRQEHNMWACLHWAMVNTRAWLAPLAASFPGVEGSCWTRPPAELLSSLSMCWPSQSERSLGQTAPGVQHFYWGQINTNASPCWSVEGLQCCSATAGLFSYQFVKQLSCGWKEQSPSGGTTGRRSLRLWRLHYLFHSFPCA